MSVANSPIKAENFASVLTQMVSALESASAKDLWNEELQPIAVEGQMDNFANARTPDGSDWPLRRYHGDPILDRGRSGVAGHPLLVDTGEMVNSIADQSDSHHVSEVLDRVFSTGTNIEYAYEHEHGEGQAERSFIGVGEEFIDRMAPKIADWGFEILAGAG